jgi:hypothetical protein
VADGARRFALQQLDRAATDVPELPTATVTAYTSGQRVTVEYLGASLQFRHLSSYTPVAGHKVVLGRSGGNWFVLGRLLP